MSTPELLRERSLMSHAELDWRVGLPISAAILALLAIPLSYVNPRAGRSLNLVLAIVLYMFYSNLISVSNAWVAQGKLSPGFGLWGIHALMLAVTLLMFKRRMMLFSWRRLFGKKRAQPEGAA
jgi:lipopolysaccharide export system permease protein